MNTALWIVTWVLAAVFTASGLMKVVVSKATLLRNPMMAWAEAWPAGMIRTIGVLEICGALGLVVPRLLDRATFLTPLAGLGLALIMVGAFVTHLRRTELPSLPVTAVLGGLAAFVAIGRL